MKRSDYFRSIKSTDLKDQIIILSGDLSSSVVYTLRLNKLVKIFLFKNQITSQAFVAIAN